jgi:hypothetical protein
MADIRYIGQAVVVAQVDKFTPGGTIESGDIFTLTITGWDGRTAAVSFAATATTVANVVAGLVAAWNASTNTLIATLTAADVSTQYVTLTADVAGVAFSVVGTTTEANGDAADDQTLVRAAVTANGSPYDWSCAANWSAGAVPGAAASQNVYVEDAIILYGLNQSGTAETLSSVNVIRSQIGTNPATGYLPVYLQVKATAVNIARYIGPGTAPEEETPILINTGSTASTITIYNTGTNDTTTMPAIRILCNSASTVLNLRKGSVGMAVIDGETATIGTINQNYDTNQDTDTYLYLGSGVTVTTIDKTGGDAVILCGATTIRNKGGTLRTEGTGAITTMTCNKGTITSNSAGTITTANAIEEGVIDLTRSSVARTITNPKVSGTGKIKCNSNITLTNPVARYDSSGDYEISGLAA